MQYAIQTSDGKKYTQEAIKKALNAVADFYAGNAQAIYDKDLYASHVTKETKESNLKDGLKRANDIRQGVIKSFAEWQRVNEELTGNCVAFLPK